MISFFPALYGILFPSKEEAAYSNFRLWEATGSVLAYAYSPYMCTYLKLYILLGFLIVGILGYCIIEYLNLIPKRHSVEFGDFGLVATNESTLNTSTGDRRNVQWNKHLWVLISLKLFFSSYVISRCSDNGSA